MLSTLLYNDSFVTYTPQKWESILFYCLTFINLTFFLLIYPVAHINMLKRSLGTKVVCPAEAVLLKRWWTQNKIYVLVMPSLVRRVLNSKAWFRYLLKCIALADTFRLWTHSMKQTNFPISSKDAIVSGLQKHVLCRLFLFCCCALKWFGMLSLCMVQTTELSLYINFTLNTFLK